MKTKHHNSTFPGRSTFFILLIMFSPILSAARVVDGSLGHWIAVEASPKLAEKLSNHPRLKGESIKLMAMKNGHPIRVTDVLTEQIREQLRDDLLTLADVRIVFEDESRCKAIDVDTVLGIEVEVHDNRSHRVSLAIVDINEGVWLNGTNLSWLGRMTNTQRSALNTQLNQDDLISHFKPTEFAEMATALHRQLKCNEFIATPIFFEPPEDDISQGILRELREKITNRNLITLDRSIAASIITFSSTAGSGGSLILELRDIGTPDQAFRIAEVYVASQHPQKSQDPISQQAQKVISAIQIEEGRAARDVCRSQSIRCIPVRFNLTQSAYTVLFYTVNGTMSMQTCETPRRQKTGMYTFGLNVPPDQSGSVPELGFYALAVTDRRAALSIHQLLKKNASRCSRITSPNDQWLSSLENLLNQYRSKVSWQTIHLAREDNQIFRI
jgi:hypothetical protein